jgi:pseudouridine synthase
MNLVQKNNGGMKIRLQKIIAQAGMASRRQAEQLITEGKVTVNGKVVTKLGSVADPIEDSIMVRRRALPTARDFIYVILNKPRGYLTAERDDRGERTVMDLLKKVKTRVFPVGRLDFNTDGLLLLTNDGALSEKLLAPKNKIPRTYRVKVRGIPDEKALNRLRRGVPLDNKPTGPVEVKIHRETGKNCFLDMTLYEGKNRHIKKVCEKIGHPVVKLMRTEFGKLNLIDLPEGAYRYLTPQEIRSLRSLVPREG